MDHQDLLKDIEFTKFSVLRTDELDNFLKGAAGVFGDRGSRIAHFTRYHVVGYHPVCAVESVPAEIQDMKEWAFQKELEFCEMQRTMHGIRGTEPVNAIPFKGDLHLFLIFGDGAAWKTIHVPKAGGEPVVYSFYENGGKESKKALYLAERKYVGYEKRLVNDLYVRLYGPTFPSRPL